MSSIVTRTGDTGTTGLIGGDRVPKSSFRLHAYGTVDELNAVLGLVLAEASVTVELRRILQRMQRVLFTVGSDLAAPKHVTAAPRITPGHVAEIERYIGEAESALPVLTRFILPGGSRCGALLHQARTICRRAERWIVAVEEQGEWVNPHVRVYVNRLSDALFLAARLANRAAGVAEEEVVAGA